jgi:arabinofuranosyltransferase
MERKFINQSHTLWLKVKKLLVVFFILLFVIVLVRTAWVCDDAYITFRTVDNFVNGYGLTWNTQERVQVYTNPLWMFLISGIYFFTREVYYSSIFFSIIIALATVILLAFKIAKSYVAAVFGIIVLLFSKAFIDYSTSGLENPLTHLILAIFLVIFFKYEINLKSLFFLSLIAGIGAFNRMDTILFFIPTLVYGLLKLRKLKGVYIIIIGFLPFILWECFSIFYYGFPFSNTAYAKTLCTGIPRVELIKQASYYFLSSIKMDPLTLSTIGAGIIIPLLSKNWNKVPVIIGVIFYLFYVIWIGGCFMSGRFFAAPLFCAVSLLSCYSFKSKKLLFSYIVGTIIVITVGLASPKSPLLSDTNYGTERKNIIDKRGIADERAFYYIYTGLLKVIKDKKTPIHPWGEQGLRARASDSTSFILLPCIGFASFYAGPKIYVVDWYGLSHPLLARLPNSGPDWSIGHFPRVRPNDGGFLISKGKIRNKDLAKYYEKILLITRGKLFSIKRLIEIWNINIGKYDHLIDSYINYYLNFPEKIRLSEASEPKAMGTPWNAINNFVISKPGIEIDLEKKYHSKHIEFSLDNNDTYQIIYFNEGLRIGEQIIQPPPGWGLSICSIKVPQEVREKGYNMIKVVPQEGDEAYSIGHIRLFE